MTQTKKDPVTLTQPELERLTTWIAQGKEHAFYLWHKWLKERDFVLDQDKHECQACKARGKYRKAILVHHVRHLKERPDLSLMMWREENGVMVRQLVSLCKGCHELAHPERIRFKYFEKRETFESVERWD